MTRIRGKPTVCERVALDKGKEYLDLFKNKEKGLFLMRLFLLLLEWLFTLAVPNHF